MLTVLPVLTVPAGSGMLKPYQERFTIPLGSKNWTEESGDPIGAACQSLRATLSFIEHIRASAAGPGSRDLDIVRKAITDNLENANRREKTWNALSQALIVISTLIVLAGVVGMFFLGVPEGAVTAAVGIVVGLIPRLLYGELHKARAEIHSATDNLKILADRARAQLAE